MNKRLVIVILISLIQAAQVSAQPCSFKISGVVKSSTDSLELPAAYIKLSHPNKLVTANMEGEFVIDNLCAGTYVVEVAFVGCASKILEIELDKDVYLELYLDEIILDLEPAFVVVKPNDYTTQSSQTISRPQLLEHTDKTLSEILAETSGINSIKSGNGVSKPMIQGNYGNRISIMNNGIAQSGQQWGLDHSPEVDPLVASRIDVIKGVSALEYFGNSLGGVILVKPGKIDQSPGTHGNLTYAFNSNGRGHGVNASLSRFHKGFGVKFISTLKKNGDYHTPDYFLNNTGGEQLNLALQVEKQWSPKLATNLYLSSFNADLGVLRGAHVGNLTDLESALQREIPFFTEPEFSYTLEAPHQRVNHQLAKAQIKFQANETWKLEANYAFQWNLRKEFDVRRNGRTDIPTLNISQWSNFLEVKSQLQLNHSWKLSSGVQLNRVDNTNDAETGILPLIPDYVSRELGVFSVLKYSGTKHSIELGARADLEDRRVATISNSIPREIIRYSNVFTNYGALAGYRYRPLNSYSSVSYNIGIAARNPEVNELFSNGLHQGVSGVEEGDVSLSTETAIKQTLGLELELLEKLSVEITGYMQNFDNYIYLQPTDEVRLTIRGAFPVFKYEQTKAMIVGADVMVGYEFSEHLQTKVQLSYLKGTDKTQNIPLVFMPSNRMSADLNWIDVNVKNWDGLALGWRSEYVFEQTHLLSYQDFAVAPKAYFVSGVTGSLKRNLKKSRLTLALRGDNIFNSRYRDYLNRQRYFADDIGRNFTLTSSISF